MKNLMVIFGYSACAVSLIMYPTEKVEQMDAQLEAMRRVYIRQIECLDETVKREVPTIQEKIAPTVKALKDGLETGLRTVEDSLSRFKTVVDLQQKLDIRS